MKFSIKDFFSKCDQIRSCLRIWSHLLKKSSMENFHFLCSAQLKNLGEYHDFYLKTDVLLLGDVFENLRKMCLEIYESDPAKFISAPALAWQMALNKTQFKLYLLTNIDMLLMVEKGIRG